MIVSYGVILFVVVKGVKYYLIINRGCSYQYIDIFNDRCPTEKVFNYVRMCTLQEKEILKKYPPETIYKDAWSKFRTYKSFLDRYNKIKDIIVDALQAPPLKSEAYMYGFPKGRIKDKESGVSTALREFNEEIGPYSQHIKILGFPPCVEEYTGTDDKQYRNVYYRGEIPFVLIPRKHRGDSIIPTREYEISEEIQEVLWVTSEEAKNYLHPRLWNFL